ncbi:MAG: MepB family protein [Gammaproteobacteria bacterium]|nr:MepB family protein [Gammaproteobacteria bacterium]
MNETLSKINTEIYKKCSFEISNYQTEEESQAYFACQFDLNNKKIICRTAKTTPKKLGQFVTFWKRDKNNITIPYEENDDFDFLVINVQTDESIGQFVLPKSELSKRGIITTTKEGKRGFRVYPKSVVVQSKQAKRTQEWQLNFYYQLSDNIENIKHLFQ